MSAYDELKQEALALGVMQAMIKWAEETNTTDEARTKVVAGWVQQRRAAAEAERQRRAKVTTPPVTTTTAQPVPLVQTNGDQAPTPTPTTRNSATTTSTSGRPEAPSGLEDRRLKIPPRYRAVWRLLYRWAGSSHRVDRVVVSRLAAIARALETEWGGFSTAVVRSAIEYLGHVSILDVRAMPAAKAQKGWRQRGEDGQFKETPVVVRVPLTADLVLADVVAKTKAMPPAARTGDPGHAARQRRYRERQKA